MTEGLVRFADSWDSLALRLASWDSALRASYKGASPFRLSRCFGEPPRTICDGDKRRMAVGAVGNAF